MQTARQYDIDAVVEPARSEALSLRTLAAYRLGELDEAAGAALTLLDKFGGQAPTYPARSRGLSSRTGAVTMPAPLDPALSAKR